MRIDNVTINITPAPSAMSKAFIEALLSGAPRASEAPAGAEASTPPKIGEAWPGMGGIYAGITRGEDGEPDQHLVLHVAEPTGRLAWQAGLDWATSLEVEGHTDFHVPTRFESALLYANLRELFDTSAWYWTSTQYSDDTAWRQYFDAGSQTNYGKKYEARVRAVRRFNA